ncbi:MAG TPA: UDP-glucose/GDP-mannose dehydrogenase family protein [Kofleriaceae bacterium]|nr:UDP-glucose/GDP-mannose dehydrogenase family protein [Kofleriaceae bacterium]HMG53290.1 UDP-glucose/GDP-mannose dehydrogenase family protein [Kofleriaceae bacterium]
MKIAVIGSGYVGLVAAAGFSDFGNHVSCVDIDEARIERLRRGEIPFHEPGLADLVQRNARQGRLSFTTDTAEAVRDTEVVFLAVGTPSQADGSADLRYVLEAARQVGRALTGFAVIVNKSTVPVGTGDLVRRTIAEVTSRPFTVASNPEFLKEGDAINDFLKPARVIIGADDPQAIDVLRRLYDGFLRTSDRIQVMDLRSAELTKYAANAMLATRISFMNELAALADKLGADIEKVRKGMGSDPRIGGKFLFPGVGFGGSCFPKDLRALRDMGRASGVQLGIIESTVDANDRSKRAFGNRVIERLGSALGDKRVAVWGLAFKPETDDIREAPALDIIAQLREVGVSVVGYDPIAADNVRAVLGEGIALVDDPYVAAEGADAILLITEWHQLRQPDFARLRKLVRTPVLFDGRNVWDPVAAQRAGFEYHAIGRPRSHD